MKESLRRVLLFAVTVITGSVMILFDVPPLVMVPLLIVVGFGILLGLGAITVTDIREIADSLKPGNLKKISIVKRLDEMKFFEKKTAQPPEKKKTGESGKPARVKDTEKKPGIGDHVKIFFSSLGSLGNLLKQHDKKGKKVEDINKLLDKTVNEKVSGSPLANAGNVAGASRPIGSGGGGAGAAVPGTEQDPFLSLSGDEFDAGLLDGLDDLDAGGEPGSGMPDLSGSFTGADTIAAEPEIPTPSMDLSSEADEILKGNTPGLGEFSGLEGGDSIDQDFGDLGDLNLDDVSLEDLSLDDVSLDDESDGESGQSASPAETPPEKSSSVPSGPAVKEIKTDWIKSDAPQGGEDQVSTHADMAAFASGSGADEDLLSSIASDVKHVKKEKDVSLLRELKDFKAPAEEIEQELTVVYDRINAIPRLGKGVVPPEKEIK